MIPIYHEGSWKMITQIRDESLIVSRMQPECDCGDCEVCDDQIYGTEVDEISISSIKNVQKLIDDGARQFLKMADQLKRTIELNKLSAPSVMMRKKLLESVPI